jgi:hypothetical protein
VVFAGFYLEALEAGLRGEPVSGRGLPRSPQRTTRAARCLPLRHVLLGMNAAYRERLAELERLATARVADLAAPGPVLLRLAARGFGVTLPPGS